MPTQKPKPRTPKGSCNGLPYRSNDLLIERVPISELKHFERRTRLHPLRQVKKIARSIESAGALLPVIIDSHDRIIDGEAVVRAAQMLGYTEIPTIRLHHLSDSTARLLRLALNRLADDGSWDEAGLGLEFLDLLEIDTAIDMEASGFEVAEIDRVIASSASDYSADEADAVPSLTKEVPTRCALGQLWALGDHRLLIGDALDAQSYARVMGDRHCRLLLTDPPYNLKIDGFAVGKGRTNHKDFAMACGEMSEEGFSEFLSEVFRLGTDRLVDGGVLYCFMDWRHLTEMLTAARTNQLHQLNLCVWTKSNGGMGSLYRSQHELIFIFKKGKSPHLNNVALGKFGRNRTNVWAHPGVNSFGRDRDAMLETHPTPKPVKLLEDAILDVTKPRDLVLDPFAGSGSTLIAAERAGRCCAAIELEPRYGDVILARYEALTDDPPSLIEDGSPTNANPE